ncbi:hypothetical protein NKI98_25805 [Mesorhizobium sp. M0222]|uniref:hypothetical protein n=1 Tax=Mesorhizobium sp. M0222 TaxID=2956921 RepID=UPI003336CE5C
MPEKTRTKPTGWMATGTADSQVVTPDWMPIEQVTIDGVRVKEIRPVATSTGYLTEIFREEWELDSEPVGQVFQLDTESPPPKPTGFVAGPWFCLGSSGFNTGSQLRRHCAETPTFSQYWLAVFFLHCSPSLANFGKAPV